MWGEPLEISETVSVRLLVMERSCLDDSRSALVIVEKHFHVSITLPQYKMDVCHSDIVL